MTSRRRGIVDVKFPATLEILFFGADFNQSCLAPEIYHDLSFFFFFVCSVLFGKESILLRIFLSVFFFLCVQFFVW